MISTPPAVSRQAATAIADRPATRPSRLPVSPPVPHSNPDITRQSRPAEGLEVNERIGKSLLRREGKGRGSGAHRTHPGGQQQRRSPGTGNASAQPGVLDQFDVVSPARSAWLDAPGPTRADSRPARSGVAG